MTIYIYMYIDIAHISIYIYTYLYACQTCALCFIHAGWRSAKVRFQQTAMGVRSGRAHESQN